MNSQMERVMQVAKEQGTQVVLVSSGSGLNGIGLKNTMIIDDDWAEFANSDDNEPYKTTSYCMKSRGFGERKQNNDWRSKHKRFSGYHETGV